MKRRQRILTALLALTLIMAAACGPAARPAIVMTERQPVRSALARETAAGSAEETLPSAGPVKTSPYNEVKKQGKADGYGGLVEVTVGLVGSEIIKIDVKEQETPDIGGAAIKRLVAAVVARNSTDIDIVAGATVSSKALLAAVRNALDPLTYPYIVSTVPEKPVTETKTDVTRRRSGVTRSVAAIGLGVAANSYHDEAEDENGRAVAGFNVALAAALFDDDDRLIDVRFDVVEIATPNGKPEGLPRFGGWPDRGGYSDGTEDGRFGDSEEEFLQSVADFRTKRDRGDKLTLERGTWAAQIDAYEEALRGKTIEEIEAWHEKNFSAYNLRPLSEQAEYEDDIDRFNALDEDDRAALTDLTASATLRLTGRYGDLLGALKKAYASRKSVDVGEAAGFGLGIASNGRIDPEKDDEGVSIYSFNLIAAATLLDAGGRIAALYVDALEIGTPNKASEFWSRFSGWPGQGGYNIDLDGDGIVDGPTYDTVEFFNEEVGMWQTKREKGDDYKLASGSWAEQADALENVFVGLAPAKLADWAGRMTSNVDGRPLSAEATGAGDTKKYEALSDEEKAVLTDLKAGATISLSDARGNWFKAIRNAADKAADLPAADD